MPKIASEESKEASQLNFEQISTTSQPLDGATTTPSQGTTTVDQLSTERLDSLLKKWDSNIKRNEGDYKKQAQDLLEAETFIFRAISQGKAIEQSSAQIKDVYIANAEIMRGIGSDQDEILKHLSQVEKELDTLLSCNLSCAQDLSEFYANPLTNLESDHHCDKRLTRQQVFQKAFQIETASDEISRDLYDSELALEKIQAANAKKQDDGIQMTLEDGSKVVIDDILNSQFETLKWIENAAMDLRFMTEDVSRKVEETSKTQEYLMSE